MITGSLRYRKYLHVIFPLFLISIIAYIDRTNVSYAALTMNKDLAFTAQMFGLGAGIFFFGYFVFEIPGALIAVKYSPRVWLARIMISWGLVCGLMATMTTPMEFYIYRFLLGAAEASLYPVIYAVIIPRWFTPDERPMAITWLLTSVLGAPIIGAPLAAVLLDVQVFGLKGWQALFVLEAIPAVVLGFVVVYWMADWPKDAKWLTEAEKQMLTEHYEAEIAVKDSARKYTFWQALCDKEVLKLCLIYFLWLTGFWGFNVWMPTVLKAVSGWSNATVGWISIIPLSVALIVFLWTGSSSSRTGEKRWHVAIPMFAAAIGLGLAPFVSDPLISMFLITLTAVGCYAGFGAWWSYPTSFLSGAAAAGAAGLINSVGNLAGFLGPTLTGYVKQITGSFQWAYVYMACSMMLAGLIILTLRKNLPTNALAEKYGKKTMGQ